MAISGKEINRSYDEFGPIRIFDDGNKRYLAFGEHDEQSCWLKSEPLIPQHDYTRAMLQVLLFMEPKRCLTLGLGSGSLNSCMHHHLPELKQQVVELRPGVVDAAYKYFQLPRGNRLQVEIGDAFEFLQQPQPRKLDLILSDIYSAEGLDEQQLLPEFLSRTREILKSDGWLVLNCWREHQTGDALQHLKSLYADVWSCTTNSGNWVLLASRSSNHRSGKYLKNRARELGQKMGFSFSASLNRLKYHSDS